MKKVWMIISIILIVIVAIIGGKIFMDKSNKITIDQQENIAKRIVRSYANVSSITFLKYYENEKTGTVGINFELNGSKELETGIIANDVSEFNSSEGIVGLNPVSKFEKLGILNNKKDTPVSLENVKITYLGE
ncbi:hypothetical protein [Listeria fleischmannii]|uniref:hypothetical protein n=1 Tax=Listeria fleischmannii TaxID=1069827 RepID=UPI00162A986F|nr:hypothetical protein [Listeria fleischmannii]MBC1419350.1 hypothetical protein [Listeria fleischmannii]